jgi:hypothetical protein
VDERVLLPRVAGRRTGRPAPEVDDDPVAEDHADRRADLVALGEVASLAEATFRRAVSEARGRGAARVVDAIVRGMRYVAASDAYRAFLERDPQKALRIVASKEGPVQRRTIAMHEELLREEVGRGTLRLPVDAHTMAYALVRTVESFLYADPIAGEKPDLKKAVEILKLMLR